MAPAAAAAAVEEQLLVGESIFREDCPGCRCSYLSRKGSGPPTKQLVYLGLIILCNALPISSLYPFLYFMVKDFNVAKSEKDIGYFAGIIGSAFMVGRFFTGIFWGVLADKYGRKMIIFVGILSVIVFNTAFGLSSGFWMAVLTRFLLGSFNGMLGIVKAYASEICSEEHQALGVSVVSTTWGLGLIVGPALGGYFSQPAIKYPNLFENTLFERFPYFLPCLCITVFAIPVMLIAYDLPETLHNHKPSHKRIFKRCSSDDTTITACLVESGSSMPRNSDTPTPKCIWKNRALIGSIAVYCIWSLHDIAYTEIFSLWALSSTSLGGLNFTSSEVGDVFAISGLCMLVFQLTFFPRLANVLGPIMVTRLSAALSIPLLAAYNYISLLQNAWLWMAIISASILKNVLSVSTNTGSFLLINNSVTQDQRGSANGLALSIVSLFKAIGPAGGGSLFAWSQTRTKALILPGDQLVFFGMNVITALMVLATFEPFLPQSTNKQIY